MTRMLPTVPAPATWLSAPLFGLALLAALPAPAQAVSMAVIVNPKNTANQMPSEQAAQYFLGRSDKLTPVDLADNSALRSAFYQRIAGKNQDQVKAIWSKIVFTGKGFPPKEYATSEAVKKAIAADPGAIGYIEREAVDSSVKVILILQ